MYAVTQNKTTLSPHLEPIKRCDTYVHIYTHCGTEYYSAIKKMKIGNL